MYSAYYNTVAAIIARILDGEHSEKELQRIAQENTITMPRLDVRDFNGIE